MVTIYKIQNLDNGNVPCEISSDAEVVEILGRSIKYVFGKELKCAGFIASGEITFYSQAPMECACYGGNMRVGRKDEPVTLKEITGLHKVCLTALLEVCTYFSTIH